MRGKVWSWLIEASGGVFFVSGNAFEEELSKMFIFLEDQIRGG